PPRPRASAPRVRARRASIRPTSTRGASTATALSRHGGYGRPPAVSRSGPATAAGRWSRLPEAHPDPTARAVADAELLLGRYGVVTRGAVVNERVPGGFAAMYKVLSGFEESGHCRRGHFVASLGAAQFA